MLAADPTCGTVEAKRVVQLFRRVASEVVDIQIGEEIISATPEHPFWVVGQGWVKAGTLQTGTQLLSKDGAVVRVAGIKRRSGTFEVFNFEVQDLHTYFVSRLGLLIHNDCNQDALKAFEKIGGGKFYSLEERGGTLYLDTPKSLYGKAEGWKNHTILVKAGKVWDKMAGMEGVPFKEWAQHWDWTVTKIRQIDINKVKAAIPDH